MAYTYPLVTWRSLDTDARQRAMEEFLSSKFPDKLPEEFDPLLFSAAREILRKDDNILFYTNGSFTEEPEEIEDDEEDYEEDEDNS